MGDDYAPDHEQEPLDVGKIIRESAIPDPGPFRLNVRTARQFSAIPDPENVELLGPLVCRSTRTIIVGDTGHGKTSLALAILSAIAKGEELLSWTGAGVGPLLVVDLEQGVRSIKRGLRESGLADRDDVLYASVPDGLALDKEREHLLALLDVVAEYRPVVVMLDPYYKAHRAEDPNAERPIIDLMRTLDSLRAVYGFALILPAHPRKDIPGREGARKLTLHDVAGSGAVTRGAEIVIAIERLSTGAARLRYLKDRDGDLPVGEALPLLYDKQHGFRINEQEVKSDETVEQMILDHVCEPGDPKTMWLTVKEWCRIVSVREDRVKAALDRLAASDSPRLWFTVGPPGRSSKAQCYSTAPEAREQSGAVKQLGLPELTAPTAPPLYRKGGEWEHSTEPADCSQDVGAVDDSEPENGYPFG